MVATPQMLANEVILANMAVFVSQLIRVQFVSAEILNMMDNIVKKVSKTEICSKTKKKKRIFNFNRHFAAEKAPSEATFRGQQFLSYDLGQTSAEPIVSAQDAITLYFRTRQPNGLLFYTGLLLVSNKYSVL